MRFALYLMPDPASALWRQASALIGYDAATGEALAQPALPETPAQALAEATSDARRYGFHLTLKAPFRFAEGQSATALETALAQFCAAREGFDPGALMLEARIGPDGRGFVCLVPEKPCPALFLLEQDAVRAFEPFRAPLTPQDIARRRPESLSPRQRELLAQYGYPFVLEEFRPHFSLTGHLDDPEGWRSRLAHWVVQAQVPLVCPIRGIGLFIQEKAEYQFRLASFFPMR